MHDVKRADEERADLVQDYAQALIDVLASEKTLEHIPVVKTVTAIVKGVLTVRDAILVQKIADFLSALSEISSAERTKMIRRLEEEPDYNRSVGTHLIELLDRIEGHRKPAMVGYCFLAYAQGRIDSQQLQRLISAIERLPNHEIDSVRKYLQTGSSARSEVHEESVQAIVNAGLARWSAEGQIGGVRAGYVDTETCRKFVELDLDTRSKPK